MFSAGVFTFAFLILLSAVDLVMALLLACGIGIVGIIPVLLISTSVLDHLYLITYTSFSTALAEN